MRRPIHALWLVFLAGFCMSMALAVPAQAEEPATRITGEALYSKLLHLASDRTGDPGLFDRLASASRAINWQAAETKAFLGNIRRLQIAVEGASEIREFFLVRETSGEVYVLALPVDPSALKAGADSPYADLSGKAKHKLEFEVRVAAAIVEGVHYDFIELVDPPQRLLLDNLFFIAIVLLIFLTMVGMGLTLTMNDFALVFKKPLAMIIGVILQFGLLPLIAMILGRLAGFYHAYPFIFLGLILVASSPGGVTSNLMTYLGKGDVALSVSLTAICTVLSLFFTPLMIALYVANIPDFSIPTMEVVKTMLVLVIIPLFTGMLIRWKAEKFAKKAEKPFAILGVFALLFLIVVGVWSNLDKFADTDRYGFAFYSVIFALTLAGMVMAGLASKLVRINNFQTRAISLEVGLRNASLAMTIALLLQDQLGDFSSSMFFASGIFGLWMYAAGAIAIFAFKKVLPVAEKG